MKVLYTRIEPISNVSAISRMTLYLCPPEKSGVDCWAYNEPFGFTLKESIDNGLGGGWEFGVGDQEFSSVKERFLDF